GGDGVVGLAELAEEVGEDGLDVGVFGEEFGGAACGVERFGDFVLPGKGDREGVMGFSAVGGELDGALCGGDGVVIFGGTFRAVEGGGEGGMEVGVERELGGGGLEVGDGVVEFVSPSDVGEGDAEVAAGVGVVGIEVGSAFKGSDG